jgi:DNA invertase Pin-like site-specific DNA recombinase
LHDLGKSAYLGEHHKNPDRYALAAFLKLVERGKIPKGSYLIVENLDRLTREHLRAAVTLFLSILDQGISIVTTTPEHIFRHDSDEVTDVIIAVVELARGHGDSKRKSDLVGSAWEEKRKAAREKRPQPDRKENRVNGMRLLTHCLPAWIEEQGGKLQAIPKKAAVVKRIYRLAARGYGRKLIAAKLNEDKVPAFGERVYRQEEDGKFHYRKVDGKPFGRGEWAASYIALILSDRRVLGEYQPRKRGRSKDGDPIRGYFPAVVTEAEWLAARAAIGKRHKRPTGRTSHDVNLFSGLLRSALDGDSYVVTNMLPSHDRGRKTRVLINSSHLEGRAKCRTFPLSVFETAILGWLKEVDAKEIINGDSVPDETLVLAGELARVEAKIAELEAALLEGDVAAIARVLRKQEELKRQLVGKLAEARQTASCPLGESWTDAQSLITALAKAKDPKDARLRLRAALRRIIEGIWLLVVPRGRDRLALVQIWFKDTGEYRSHFLIHRPAWSNGHRKYDKPAQWCCRSGYPSENVVNSYDDPTPVEDLRNPGSAKEAEEGLEQYPAEWIERLLADQEHRLGYTRRHPRYHR